MTDNVSTIYSMHSFRVDISFTVIRVTNWGAGEKNNMHHNSDGQAKVKMKPHDCESKVGFSRMKA